LPSAGAAPNTGTTPSTTTLQIGSGGAPGTGALALNNATLVPTTSAVTLLGTTNYLNTNNSTTTLTMSGIIGGTGAMIASGGGTVNLTSRGGSPQQLHQPGGQCGRARQLVSGPRFTTRRCSTNLTAPGMISGPLAFADARNGRPGHNRVV
jgi:hypothetical protein